MSSSENKISQKPHIQIKPEKDRTEILLTGRLDEKTVPAMWNQLVFLPMKLRGNTLIINAGQVSFCDGAGIAFLFELERTGINKKMATEIRNLPQDFQSLLIRFDKQKLSESLIQPTMNTNFVEDIGKATVEIIWDLLSQITFLGHFSYACFWTLLHPRRFRWNDFLKLIELIGVNAMGITLLMGLLFGLIMAFSAAMPLRQFGVEVYVSDLVAIALARVLGPFITAIIIAGRTGSAFAAELGTMKINNELDALEVMSLEPMRFLIVPRVLATILMAPLLTTLTLAAGLIGSGFVISSLGYSISTYYEHVQYILAAKDILVGIVKSLFFGALVGGIGCLRGIQTKSGAGAVGISTTRAVVSGIVLIVVAEGIFSVLLYILKI